MLVIADSGSTNTGWIIRYGSGEEERLTTIGLNPNYTSPKRIRKTIKKNILPHINQEDNVKVRFYGSGCGGTRTIEIMEGILINLLPGADIFVESDLFGASRAMFGKNEGIACILGTGSNSGFYDGTRITSNIPSLGFILGDEGSGTYMGKIILADYLKGIMPAGIADKFNSVHNINREKVIEKVYRGDFPARFVADFVKFIKSAEDEDYMAKIIDSAFQAFIDRNISLYNDYNSFKISFTGSIAWEFREQLKKVFQRNSLLLGDIVRNPIDKLLEYHTKFEE